MNHFAIAILIFFICFYYLIWCFINYVYNVTVWSDKDVSNLNIFKWYYKI